MTTKRLILAVCCMLAAACCYAQDGAIRVNYKGARPTIVDFAEAYFAAYVNDDDDDCINESLNAFYRTWIDYRNGQPLDEGETFVLDERNGYILYETKSTYEQTTHTGRMEMCYWNESDGKHKLFACSIWFYTNGLPSGGQFDDLYFFRYDNATKKMTACDAPGFDVSYDRAYSLPRTGKDITVTLVKNGKKQQQLLKWNGHKFSY